MMRRRARLLAPIALVASTAVLARVSVAIGQTQGDSSSVATAASMQAQTTPFGAGERFSYEVKFGSIRVGTGQMEVHGIDTIRGREAWHTSFWVRGGTFFYRVDDQFESWIDPDTFSSLRFLRQIQEGTRERQQHFEIYPEQSKYVRPDKKPPREYRSVRQPLDEGSFLYFVRTIPLVVGQTYDFNRYFMADRNPVRLRVLRKEAVTVPAGTFNAIVIQPIIKTKGIFSEGGQAEVWLTDDSRRMLLQVKTRLPFGSLNLYLRSYALATGQATKAGDR
jgi:uncharacterized protein DUF3108